MTVTIDTLRYKTMVFNWFLLLLSCSFGIILNAFIASHMPASLYGDFSIAMSMICFTAPYFVFGAAASLSKFIPKYHSKNDSFHFSGLIQWMLRSAIYAIAIGIPLVCLLLCISLLLARYQLFPLDSLHMAFYTQLGAPLFAVITLIYVFLRSVRYIMLSSFIKTTLKTITFFILFALFFFFINQSTINNVVFSILIVSSIFIWFVFSLFILCLISNNEFKTFFSRQKNKRDRTAEHTWSKYSRSLLINSNMHELGTFLDLLVLECIPFHGEHNVGFFAAFKVIGGLLSIASKASTQAFKPYMASALSDKEKQRAINQVNCFTFIVIGLSTLSLVSLSSLILGCFGTSYVEHKDLLCVYLICSALASLPKLSGLDALYNGYQKALVYQHYFYLLSILIFGSLFYFLFGLSAFVLTICAILLIKSMVLFLYVKTRSPLKFMLFI